MKLMNVFFIFVCMYSFTKAMYKEPIIRNLRYYDQYKNVILPKISNKNESQYSPKIHL